MTIDARDFIVLGSGEATAPEPEMIEAKARATIRYADPAAWIAAAAIAHATLKVRGETDWSPHEVGVIVISDSGPVETMAIVGAAAAEGQPSPLRYPAAGPGSMVGVSCIAFGFRGPTMNLAMTPELGLPLALQLCDAWLKRKVIRQMVVATLIRDDSGNRVARALLLGRPGGLKNAGLAKDQPRPDWLLNAKHQGNSIR